MPLKYYNMNQCHNCRSVSEYNNNKCSQCKICYCNECFYNYDHLEHFIGENDNVDFLSSLIDILIISKCRFDLYVNDNYLADSGTKERICLLEMQQKKSMNYDIPIEPLSIEITYFGTILNVSINGNYAYSTLGLMVGIINTLEINLIMAMCSYYKIDKCDMVNLIAKCSHVFGIKNKLIECLYELYKRTGLLPTFRLYEHNLSQPSGYSNRCEIRPYYLYSPTIIFPKYPKRSIPIIIVKEHVEFKQILYDSYKYRKRYTNKKEQYIIVLELTLVLSFLPPYVILWIFDNLWTKSEMSHREMISLIQKVWNFKNVKSENYPIKVF